MRTLLRHLSRHAFVGLSLYAASVTAGDSYTTTWIRKNWLANPVGTIGPCRIEGSEPSLYGERPTVARSWEVGAGKVALAVGAAAALKRRKRLEVLWPLPLLIVSIDSSIGFSHNLLDCPR